MSHGWIPVWDAFNPATQASTHADNHGGTHLPARRASLPGYAGVLQREALPAPIRRRTPPLSVCPNPVHLARIGAGWWSVDGASRGCHGESNAE